LLRRFAPRNDTNLGFTMILHIDMDAFFASIEQAINPRLKGKPLIVGSRPNKLHTIVCAASYEAKNLGIDSGMPSQEAFKICPDLEFVASDQSKYIWTSEQIFKLLETYGFALNYASIDEFQLDIKDTPQPESLAKEIQRNIQENFQITASIGIAKNCLLAKLASKLNKPNGIAILSAENLKPILSKTPVKKICGIGASSSTVLSGLGVDSCLDLYQKPIQFFYQAFGKYGLNLYHGLHAKDSLSQSQIEQKPKSIGHSYTFPAASETPGFIYAWLSLLSEMVSRRLRQNHLVAQTVHLWLNGPQIGNFSQQKTFQQATCDPYEVYQRSRKIIAVLGQRVPKIRALGISCSKLFSDDYPPLLKEQKRREGLIKALDRINSRFGENTIYPALITLAKKIS